ncbi:MAG: class I SAM-dependent methyltransferase family protein [Thermoproteota archaeon]|nr:class I SAM-dependent methyltransferase family protein [Thermoproteota archaeon]
MRGDLKQRLKGKLTSEELEWLYKSYDIVGDVAIIRVPAPIKRHSETIAEAIMQTQKRVKAVWRQTSAVSGELRLRELEWVAGERRIETTHKEFGCLFKVNLEECYFSPRLSHERMRIARQVQPGEVVVNMFAGVGCYSIIIAKHSQADKIYSIDLNPVAIRYMQENIKLNKLEKQVISIQGDAEKIVKEKLRNVANRVLMPLPEKAYAYLNCAVLALKSEGGWVHYYDFEHAEKNENPVHKVKMKVSEKLQSLGVDFEIPFSRVVRTTGPNWYQIVLDLRICSVNHL